MSCTAILLTAALVLWLPGAASETGRGFAGFYTTADVVDLGDEVSLTLKLRVFNYSGADVSDATLRLRGNLVLEDTYSSFAGVWIATDESVRLEGTLVLPRHEYEQWKKGATPHVRIEFKDSAAQAREHVVELGPMLLDEGE